MSRRDPLTILRLLRQTEVEAARQHAAEAFDRRHRSEQAIASVANQMEQEQRSVEFMQYAAWTPAIRARLQVLTSRLTAEEGAAAEALSRLSVARLAEQVVVEEQQRRKRADRRQRLEKEQKLLDDL